MIWGRASGASRDGAEMPPLPSGVCWRTVLARAHRARLSSGSRGASGDAGCAQDHPAVVGELRGELDRFGGVSVRLGALDRLDAAAFQRGLQGKCAWAEGLRGTRAFLMKGSGPTPVQVPSPEGRGEGAVTRPALSLLFLCPLLGGL